MMKVFIVMTEGIYMCGTAIVIAESEEKAKEIFSKEHNEEWDNIIDVKELNLTKERVYNYDDGDR